MQQNKAFDQVYSVSLSFRTVVKRIKDWTNSPTRYIGRVRYVRLYDVDIPKELFANSADPDQMLHSVESDLGLHCLPVTTLGVSSLQ